MNVSLNPAVSFKSDTNLIAQRIREQNASETIARPDIPELNSSYKEYPTSWGPDPKMGKIKKETDEFLKKESNKLNEEGAAKIVGKQGLSFEETLKDKDWNKKYLPDANIIHVSQNGVYDGKEYEISSDGKVLQVGTWQKEPKVIKEPNKEMAEYFENIKSGKADAKASIAEIAEQADLTEGELLQKITDFQDRFKNRKWEKKFLPESDLIFIRQKGQPEGTEYILEKDGTVREVGLRAKSLVLMEPNSRMAEEFNKIKAKEVSKEDGKSLWYNIKDTIADVMKFFSMLGTMVGATAKGTLYAAGTGIGVIMAATILRTPKLLKDGVKMLDIYKHPAASAGKAGKIIAGIGALAVFAGHIIAGKLQANQDTAVIEHKFRVDHRDH